MHKDSQHGRLKHNDLAWPGWFSPTARHRNRHFASWPVENAQGFSSPARHAKCGLRTAPQFTSQRRGSDARKNDSRLGGGFIDYSRMCTGTRTAARKKSERRNAWECRFLEIQEVPSGNNENAKR